MCSIDDDPVKITIDSKTAEEGSSVTNLAHRIPVLVSVFDIDLTKLKIPVSGKGEATERTKAVISINGFTASIPVGDLYCTGTFVVELWEDGDEGFKKWELISKAKIPYFRGRLDHMEVTLEEINRGDLGMGFARWEMTLEVEGIAESEPLSFLPDRNFCTCFIV